MTHHNADELVGRTPELLERAIQALERASNDDFGFIPVRPFTPEERDLLVAALRHPQQPQGGVVSERLREALLSSPCWRPVFEAGDDHSVRKCIELDACGCDNKAALAAFPSPVGEDGEDFSRKIPKIPDGWQLVPAWLIEFLHGAGTDPDGRWFGDRKEGEGAFWWRKHLRALSATPVSPVAQSELSDHELNRGKKSATQGNQL